MVSERHPLKDGFRRARLLSNFFDFPYRVGSQEGWAGAQSLFTDDDERFARLGDDLWTGTMGYGRLSCRGVCFPHRLPDPVDLARYGPICAGA